MAIYVSKTAYLMVGATDLTDHVKSVSITIGAEAVDSTAMTNNTRIVTPGLATWTIEADLYQDTATSKVDQTIGPNAGTVVAVKVRPTNSAIAATNPEFQGNGLIESYIPVQGNVGEMAIARVVFKAAGDLVRDTTP
jgi:hypothetical protein